MYHHHFLRKQVVIPGSQCKSKKISQRQTNIVISSVIVLVWNNHTRDLHGHMVNLIDLMGILLPGVVLPFLNYLDEVGVIFVGYHQMIRTSRSTSWVVVVLVVLLVGAIMVTPNRSLGLPMKSCNLGALEKPCR